MRCHGMNNDALKTVYKSVVLAKLLYASPAWLGFATSSDIGRTEAHVRRAVCRHDCSLTVKSDARNFITRQLFKYMY